jgi:hypothetical protein
MACESAVDWPDWVTWGLVLSGWFVVHRTELHQERRKENRVAVTQIIDEVKEIERQAIAFHSSEKYSAEASDSLTWRIGRLNRCLQRVPLDELKIPLPLMVRFKKAFTLENADSSSFVPQAYHGMLIVGIRQIADEMIDAVESGRDRMFK